MRVRIAWIGRTKDAAVQSLTAEYLKRIKQYADVDALSLNGEDALLKLLTPLTVNPSVDWPGLLGI